MPKISECLDIIQEYCRAAIEGQRDIITDLKSKSYPFSFITGPNEVQSAVVACLSDDHLEAAGLLLEEGCFLEGLEVRAIIEEGCRKNIGSLITWFHTHKRKCLRSIDIMRICELVYNGDTSVVFFTQLLSLCDISAEERAEVLHRMSELLEYKQAGLSFEAAKNDYFTSSEEIQPEKNSKKRSSDDALPAEKKAPNRLQLLNKTAYKMGIHGKYLSMPAIPTTGQTKNNSTMFKTDHMSVYRSPTSPVVSDLANAYLLELSDDWFTFDYYSLSLEPINDNERITFVFAGRGSKGFFPEETEGGRIILILKQEEFDQLHIQWLLPNRDICVIKGLSMMGMENGQPVKMDVPENELGLIASRRLAGFYLAHYFSLKHVIFLDDNVAEYAVALENPLDTPQWKDIYNFFAQQVQAKGAEGGSPRSWGPFIKKSKVREDEAADLENKLGSKLFYINFAEVSKHFNTYEKLSTLLTHHRKLWGEDIFFQFMLMTHLDMVVLDPLDAFIVRASRSKSAAKGTVRSATAWLEMKEDEFIPGDQVVVYSLIKKSVQENVERYKKRLEHLASLDLRDIQANKLGEPSQTSTTLTDAEKRPKLNGTVKKLEAQTLETLFESDTITVRDYQKEAVRKLMAATGQVGYKQSPPRTGKTLIMWFYIAALIRSNAEWKGHIIVVSPQRALVNQFYEDGKRYRQEFANMAFDFRNVIKMSSDERDVCCSLVQMNRRAQHEPLVIICCDNSLQILIDSNRNFLDSVAVSIVDEVHQTPEKLLSALTTHARANQRTAIAVSATVGKVATGLYLQPLFKLTLLEAYKKGVIAPFTVDAFDLEFSKENVTIIIDVFPTFLESVHPSGKRFGETKTVVYVPSILHADNLLAVLQNNSIKASLIHSNKNGTGQQRKATLREFADPNSGTNVLILVEMLKYGVTLHNCKTVVYLHNSKDEDKYAEDTYQAAARCFGASDGAPGVAAVVLFKNSNIKGMQDLINDKGIKRLCHPDYLAHKEKPVKQLTDLISFETMPAIESEVIEEVVLLSSESGHTLSGEVTRIPSRLSFLSQMSAALPTAQSTSNTFTGDTNATFNR